jgi:membrane-associated protease RseP (regulator of RpoE activity)
MTNRMLLLAAGVFVALSPGTLSARQRSAPAPRDVRHDEKGTFLGALFCAPRSESPSTTEGNVTVRAASNTQKANGVLVTYVLPDSPAARADLRRNDRVLEYDGQKIRDGDHLATLIRADKPARKVKLLVQRGKRDLTVEVTLALGPALRLSSPRAAGDTPETVKGTAKPNGPASVSVWATPLDSGKVKVAIEYYASGRLKTITCEGAAEVAQAIAKLPERERNLVRVALQRLRTLHNGKDAEKPAKR